eukprot:14506308-Heterocapsa_arctica.AAC.1
MCIASVRLLLGAFCPQVELGVAVVASHPLAGSAVDRVRATLVVLVGVDGVVPPLARLRLVAHTLAFALALALAAFPAEVG